MIATEMAITHNCIIRGLNSIYLQASHLEQGDFKPFIAYCKAWYHMVHAHHSGEERFLFPMLEKNVSPNIMSENKADHDAFDVGAQRYIAYLQSLEGREQDFDAKELLSIMDGFASTLYEHLKHEITTLEELKQYGKDDEVDKAWKFMVQKFTEEVKLVDLINHLPLNFMLHDLDYEDGLHKNFPDAPAVLVFLARYVLSWWNWQWWQFAPCDRSGKKRPLYALTPKK
jgi:hypothetical protein